MRDPAASLKPGRSGLGVLILLGSISAIAPMSIDMYLPALPNMADAFGRATADVQITVAAFLAGVATGQAFYGAAADRLGRRAPLLFGVALFAVASAGCALAPSLEALAALRFVQALGGCAGMVVARAIVRDRYDLQDSARVFSMLMLIVGVAPILAPIAGSWLLAAFDWRALFWVLTGFGVLLWCGTFFLLAETLPARVAERARHESPFAAYAAVLRNPQALRFGTVVMLTMSCFFSFITTAPHLLIDVYGFSPQAFGLYFGLNAAGIIGATQLNRLLLRAYPTAAILRGALAGAMVGSCVFLAIAWSGAFGQWALLGALFATLCCIGLAMPNGAALAMSVDPERAGSVSAVVGTLQFLGGAGISTLLSLAPTASATPLALVMLAVTVLASALLALNGEPRRRVH